MGARWTQALGAVLAVGAAAVALAVLLPRLLGGAAGPETAIYGRLKAAEQRGMSLPVPGAGVPLVASQVKVGPTSIHLEEGGGRAVAVTLLDFTGKLGATEVSSLGYERVPFVLQEGEWVPEAGEAPRLVAAVAALEARRQALEAGDREALAALATPGSARQPAPALTSLLEVRGRTYRVKAWLLRSEREEVVVAERYRLTGTLPARPVDEVGLRNLTLAPVGEKLFFSAGLM